MDASPSTSEEIDEKIEVLLFPSGDWQYQRAREEAFEYLMMHADDAYPRLLELLEGSAPPALLVNLIWRFGRADTVPVLEKLLREDEDYMTIAAAQSLGRHPSPDAADALERALTDSRHQVVISAVEGLAQRGDERSCTALRAALVHNNAEVRARILSAIDRISNKP